MYNLWFNNSIFGAKYRYFDRVNVSRIGKTDASVPNESKGQNICHKDWLWEKNLLHLAHASKSASPGVSVYVIV